MSPTLRFLRQRYTVNILNINLIKSQRRGNFFHAYDQTKSRRKSPGSVFKPLTWKPRWRLQATLFIICCGFPWVIAFHHGKIPYFDKTIERMVTQVWHFEDKDNFDTFDRLPPVKTMYDPQLEKLKDVYGIDDDNRDNIKHFTPKDFAKQSLEDGQSIPIISNQQ